MDKISLFNVVVLKNHREQFAMNGKEARERERERGRDRERGSKEREREERKRRENERGVKKFTRTNVCTSEERCSNRVVTGF